MAGPKWPERPWNPYSFRTNSDGILIYPGPDATPLASTRLENLRDGIEDYEGLRVLADLVAQLRAEDAAAPLLAVPEQLSKSWTSYTNDPDVVTDTRARVDALIVQAARLVAR